MKNNILFDEVLTANDVMFSIKSAFYAEKITASEEIIYCITRTGKSLTSDVSEEKYRIRLNVFLNKYIFLQNNLEASKFRILQLSARGFIMRALKGRYGFKNTINIVRYIKKNKVPYMSWNIMNPHYIFPIILENVKSAKEYRYFHK